MHLLAQGKLLRRMLHRTTDLPHSEMCWQARMWRKWPSWTARQEQTPASYRQPASTKHRVHRMHQRESEWASSDGQENCQQENTAAAKHGLAGKSSDKIRENTKYIQKDDHTFSFCWAWQKEQLTKLWIHIQLVFTHRLETLQLSTHFSALKKASNVKRVSLCRFSSTYWSAIGPATQATNMPSSVLAKPIHEVLLKKSPTLVESVNPSLLLSMREMTDAQALQKMTKEIWD